MCIRAEPREMDPSLFLHWIASSLFLEGAILCQSILWGWINHWRVDHSMWKWPLKSYITISGANISMRAIVSPLCPLFAKTISLYLFKRLWETFHAHSHWLSCVSVSVRVWPYATLGKQEKNSHLNIDFFWIFLQLLFFALAQWDWKRLAFLPLSVPWISMGLLSATWVGKMASCLGASLNDGVFKSGKLL